MLFVWEREDMGIQISIDGLDGVMTFEEWKAGLSDEQRAAMEANVKSRQKALTNPAEVV